ncbi:hypothetical protein AcW2_007190 [Taiwanofungus camphoratus]|nr:hypothetical protein AcW2_007190 [Antrodia cinnamomea]
MYSLPATLFPKSMNGSKPIILAFGYVFDFALTLDSGRLFTYIDNCLGSTEVIYWRPESSVFLACQVIESLIIVSLELSTVRRANALISRPQALPLKLFCALTHSHTPEQTRWKKIRNDTSLFCSYCVSFGGDNSLGVQFPRRYNTVHDS